VKKVTPNNLLWLIVAFAVFATGSFIGGRQLEMSRSPNQLGIRTAIREPSPSAPPTSDYRQLHVTDLLREPFPKFYEALRVAPPAARLEWGQEREKLPNGRQKTAAVRGFYKLLVQLDPVAAIDAVEKSHDSTALEAIVGAAPQWALPQLAEMIIKMPREVQDRAEGGQHDDYDAVILGEWIDIDPEAVARFIDQHDTEPEEEGYDRRNGKYSYERSEILGNWTAIDPRAAKAWAQRNQDKLPDDALRSYLYGWLTFDRPSAIKYILDHAEDPKLEDVINALASELFDQSRDEAEAFIKKLPTAKQRAKACYGIAQHSWNNALEDPTDTLHASRSVAEWLLHFPDEEWDGSFTEFISLWAEGPEDFCAWIQQQPPELRDKLATQLHVTEVDDLEKTARAVFTVADPALQQRMLRGLCTQVSGPTDETVAAIRRMSLAPGQQQRLVSLVEDIAAASQPAEPTDNSGEETTEPSISNEAESSDAADTPDAREEEAFKRPIQLPDIPQG